MHIDIWSDIACPWCWVGKKHIEQALAAFDRPVKIAWRAFELNPQAPASAPESVDYASRLADKYGMSRQDAEGFMERMVQAGRETGIDFRFDRIRPCNTFNAHRLLAWAYSFERQDPLKERFFQAYMSEGLDLSDPSTLSRLASDVGLDAEEAAAVLATGAFADDVHQDKARASELGINGVPYFVFGSGIAASGAQPPELLLRALRHVHDLQTPETGPSSEVASAPDTCGVDGCD